MPYRAQLRCHQRVSLSDVQQSEAIFAQSLESALGTALLPCKDAFTAMQTMNGRELSTQQFQAAVKWLNAYEAAKDAACQGLSLPVEAYFEIQPSDDGHHRPH